MHALFCLKLFGIIMRNGFPCIIENPRASRLWFFEEVTTLLEAGAKLLITDMCAYGTRWRKRTGLLVCNLSAAAEADLARKCGGCDGLCGRTQRPHILFKGKDPVSKRN